MSGDIPSHKSKRKLCCAQKPHKQLLFAGSNVIC